MEDDQDDELASFCPGQTKFRSQSRESETDFALTPLTETGSILPNTKAQPKVLTRQIEDLSSGDDENEQEDIDDSISIAESDISVQTQHSRRSDEMVVYRSETGRILVPYITQKGVRYMHMRNDSEIAKYQHLTIVDLSTSDFTAKTGKWAKQEKSKKPKSN
jgi:hypothetical protein